MAIISIRERASKCACVPAFVCVSVHWIVSSECVVTSDFSFGLFCRIVRGLRRDCWSIGFRAWQLRDTKEHIYSVCVCVLAFGSCKWYMIAVYVVKSVIGSVHVHVIVSISMHVFFTVHIQIHRQTHTQYSHKSCAPTWVW